MLFEINLDRFIKPLLKFYHGKFRRTVSHVLVNKHKRKQLISTYNFKINLQSSCDLWRRTLSYQISNDNRRKCMHLQQGLLQIR